MGRWHARLAELRGHPQARSGVQSVQHAPSRPVFEHIEHIEHGSAPWTEAHDERAAIIEFDAKVPRAWAEALARLDHARPPAGVPARDWLRFINACGRFVDSGWHKQAAALGWGPLDLFGCDRNHPIRKIDATGLLWRIGDYELRALTRDIATLATPAGILYVRRRPTAPGSVLAWEACERQNDQ